MKKLILAAVAAMGLAGAALEATTVVAVSGVTAKQRFPWDGMVDIDCTVSCSDPTADIALSVSATDKATSRQLSVHRVWHESDATHEKLITVKAGKHRIVWDARQDEPNLVSGNVAFDVQAFVGKSFYMVIDLSGGTNATHYPITYLNQVPAGGWTETYKREKLVMRLIPPGTFTMGSPSGEYTRSDDEIQHSVTLTKPFYMGVFEVTQSQYERVMGASPSGFVGEMRPVENVTSVDIRGNCDFPSTLAVDGDSFVGRMRTRTGIGGFDVPTEAQWEYACRAGTTSAINDGSEVWYGDYQIWDSASSWHWCSYVMHDVGKYSGNYGPGTATVGSYAPNRWGLYDMHGNVWEICRDWYGAYVTTMVENPTGVSAGWDRVCRGGSYVENAQFCRSAYRHHRSPDVADDNKGFRLFCEAEQH